MSDNKDSNRKRTAEHMEAYDARAICRLVRMGEPLSTSAAQYGYTPSEAEELLRKYP